jgi:hypothetical protein
MKKSETKGFTKKIILLMISFLVLIVLLFAFFFFQAIRHAKMEGLKYPPRSPLGIFLSGEWSFYDTGAIESWMTFDFVNNVYHLPPNYLKDTLHIEDSRYPKIPIGRYAKSIGFTKEDFTNMVQRAVDLSREIPPNT